VVLVASQPQHPMPAGAPPERGRDQGAERGQRSPWSLRLASWCWGVAGFVFVLGPGLAVLLLWMQYRALRRSTDRIASLTELFGLQDTVDLEPYLERVDAFEAWFLQTSGWVLVLLLIAYVVAAAAILAAYLLICTYTLRGANAARVLGTVLAGLSTLIAFVVWQAFATVAWLPLDALAVNHLGLLLMGLHVAGIVFAWLPASNRFAR